MPSRQIEVQMLKRIGMAILSVLLCVAFAALGGHFFGADGLVLVLIGVAGIGALVQTYRKRWIEKSLAAIDDADEPPVRFDGTPKEARRAVEVATSEGWVAEHLPQQRPEEMSILFKPGESASSTRSLVRALVEAGFPLKVLS